MRENDNHVTATCEIQLRKLLKDHFEYVFRKKTYENKLIF